MSPGEPPLFGLILAGGRSSRMGLDRPKPLLEIGGKSMVRRVADRLHPFVSPLLVATDRPDLYGDLGVRTIVDEAPGHAGPLAGLQAGALHALAGGEPHARLVSAPADTPFLPEDFVPRLADGATPDELRVAAFEDSLHPVCALWPHDALRHLAALRLDAAAAPSLRSVMREFRVVVVAFPAAAGAPAGDPFFNVNTPDDLAVARRTALFGG
ncbi:molybdenum cofactor guanylyltransferase [Aureimonas sp. SK2]|uniref:molybdenum cofactor guanylyltransferase n=1 Tax=Aureimonas sp. SK2 TaxID=3015992 RepID=UPI0024446E91|nr:NTP transferase domain-containing protein [Aureimonas sp. SK2]